MNTRNHEITRILEDWNRGNKAALDRLMPLVTAELRRLASRLLADEKPGHTLQPTALVNELYLRMLGRRRVTWQKRAHFFGFAASTMRRILVDHARSKLTAKRGGQVTRIPMEDAVGAEGSREVDLIELDDALNRLSDLDPQLSRIVELRTFAGLKQQEIAEVLDVSVTTVWRNWTTAKAWLFRELKGR